MWCEVVTPCYWDVDSKMPQLYKTWSATLDCSGVKFMQFYAFTCLLAKVLALIRIMPKTKGDIIDLIILLNLWEI